jgi:excisionase family DNA binding protein
VDLFVPPPPHYWGAAETPKILFRSYETLGTSMRAYLCRSCLDRGVDPDPFDVCPLCGGAVEFFATFGETHLRVIELEEETREHVRLSARLAIGTARPVQQPASPAAAEPWLTVDEAAAALRLHRDTVVSRIAEGRLAALDFGSAARPLYRVPASALTAGMTGVESRLEMATTVQMTPSAEANRLMNRLQQRRREHRGHDDAET